jgi:hypothetical protein
VMQRLHDDDLCGFLLRNGHDWMTRSMPSSKGWPTRAPRRYGTMPHLKDLAILTTSSGGASRSDFWKGRRCRPECGWNWRGRISSNVTLSDHAARSIG